MERELPHNAVIDIGTTALDCKHEGNFSGDTFMGSLALIGPDNKVRKSGIIFEAPPADLLAGGHAGGIGNAANAVAAVLEAETLPQQHTWALMAWLGNDDAGRIWTEKIDATIDKSLLKTHPTIPYSGLSVIRVQGKEYATDTVPAGDRAIYFRAGASGATKFTREHLRAISERSPFNVHISYPGLFPDGADKRKGRNLAWFVKEAQKICGCVSMDIHGFTKISHIKAALPYVDMFNSNFADAARVFLHKDVTEHISDVEKASLCTQMFEVIIRNYMNAKKASKDRYRMFTITDKKGTFLIFQDPGQKQLSVEYVPSPCSAIPAKDKTGAGDVRFALQRLYVATRANQEWKSGTFDADQARIAVNIGQIGTTLHIQGQEMHALHGVSISALETVARSGKEFTDVGSLQRALGEV